MSAALCPDPLEPPDPATLVDMAVPSPPAPVLMVFDVMFHNGRDLTQLPLRERRVQLVDVLAGSERVFPVRRLAENGLKAWEQVLERGYEGLVAKDETSVYAGGVTRSWLKVKVPGWTDPEDRFKRLRLTRVRES